jgi:serine/threonine protein kinase
MMLSGKQPFDHENVSKLIQLITHGCYSLEGSEWKKISPLAKDLLKHMLQVDPALRLSATQVLAHPWFNQSVHELCPLALAEVRIDLLHRAS